jgi:site-specific recombinase XerD
MILIAMETGLRLSELISLRWTDVVLNNCGGCGYIRCIGKGRKERSTPLMPQTVKIIRQWESETDSIKTCFVFSNTQGSKMSPDCFQKQLKKYSRLSANLCRSILRKKITPHVLRHTAAMNLLYAGVDITTIAIILGHDSLGSTGIYIEENIKMKEEALKKLTPRKGKLKRFKAGDKLMNYLNNL